MNSCLVFLSMYLLKHNLPEIFNCLIRIISFCTRSKKLIIVFENIQYKGNMSRHRNIRNISLDDGKFSLPNHFPKNVIFRNKINILLFPICTAQNYLPPITLLLLYFTFAFYKQILSGSLLKKKNKTMFSQY